MRVRFNDSHLEQSHHLQPLAHVRSICRQQAVVQHHTTPRSIVLHSVRHQMRFVKTGSVDSIHDNSRERPRLQRKLSRLLVSTVAPAKLLADCLVFLQICQVAKSLIALRWLSCSIQDMLHRRRHHRRSLFGGAALVVPFDQARVRRSSNTAELHRSTILKHRHSLFQGNQARLDQLQCLRCTRVVDTMSVSCRSESTSFASNRCETIKCEIPK